MNVIIEILMRRDGDTKEEAIARIEEARERIFECGGSFNDAEDIMQEVLGLEMDFIFGVLE